MTQAEATMPLLKGFGLAIVFLWLIASLVPAVNMLYGAQPNYWIESLFLLIGPWPIIATVPVLLYMAKNETQTHIIDWFREKSGLIALYAALWLTVYPLLR